MLQGAAVQPVKRTRRKVQGRIIIFTVAIREPFKNYLAGFVRFLFPIRAKNDVFLHSIRLKMEKRPYNGPKRAKMHEKKAKNRVFKPKIPAF